MQYNKLGKSGLKVSELSFGSWLTFANDIDIKQAKRTMHYAFEQGINFFDNAEVYAAGKSEQVMGEALKDFRREDLVLSTKLYWGGSGPNEKECLNRKHLIEGTKNALKRLQTDYVDLVYCHRHDPETPMEEIVLAMDYLVRQGYAFYWGTSEWSAELIDQAYQVAKELHCIPPTMEQPEYSLLHRERVEQEYAPLYKKYGLGTTIWSPLASGVLTGKYHQGIPSDSRYAKHPEYKPNNLDQRIEHAKHLQAIADQLGCSLTHLALAWCLKNPHVSTVILGASHLQQLEDNMQALKVKSLLSDDVMQAINKLDLAMQASSPMKS